MANFYINPSEFKHPITIERSVKAKDNDNRLVENWNKLCNARAKILYTRGSEFAEAYGNKSNTSVTFYIRHNHIDITTKDKITYKNKSYNIIYINNIQESNKYYEIKAEMLE